MLRRVCAPDHWPGARADWSASEGAGAHELLHLGVGLSLVEAAQVAFWSSASAGRCGHVFGLFMRPSHAPLAIMPFARVRSRSATAKMGFPDPAVSTGFVHQLLSALPNIVDAACGCASFLRERHRRFVVTLAVRHQCPDRPADKPEPTGALAMHWNSSADLRASRVRHVPHRWRDNSRMLLAAKRSLILARRSAASEP